MKWTPGNTSQDIEDRRGEGGGSRFGGGRGLGVGGFVVLLILSVVFKQDLFSLLGQGGLPSGGQAAPSAEAGPVAQSPEEEKRVKFVSFVLDSAQAFWQQEFAQKGAQYRHAKLVLFRDGVQSGCGNASAATGPFYCPADEKVYIDLGFYDELKQRFGAPGEFAQAYVLAHEVGHHVQKLLGIESKVRRMQEQNPSSQNPLSVRMELQADCLAGVWGHSTQQRGLLQNGDIESALGAAAAVGDDRLQKMSTGHVSPETFTHGSSQQRMAWFRKGFDSGSIAACNTFDSNE